MGSPLDSAQFVRLLDKRLREVAEDKYSQLPTMIPTFFNVMSSESAWEEFYAVGGVGDIPEFNGKLTYLPIIPGWHKKVEHKEFAAGIVAERKLIDDKKYGVLDNRAEKLMVAARRTQEKQAVRVFAYVDSIAFDYQTSEEGVALVSSSHTTKSSVSTTNGFDNSGTAALSKTSVAATRIAMRGFKNDDGERIEVGDDLALVVPDNLADTAMEIVGTQKSLDTGDGNINPQYGRYEVIPYLRLDDYDTNNWGMVWKSQMKEDLAWLNRINPETKNTVDFETYQLKQAVYFRNSWLWKDWRWIYWNIVS
jgi:phage major head subunit gpT-like protein